MSEKRVLLGLGLSISLPLLLIEHGEDLEHLVGMRLREYQVVNVDVELGKAIADKLIKIGCLQQFLVQTLGDLLMEIGGVPVDQTLQELAHFNSDVLTSIWVVRVAVSLVLLMLLMLLHLLVLDPVLTHVDDALLSLLVQILQICN